MVSARYTEIIDSLRAECKKQPDMPTVLMGHFTVATATIGATQASYMMNEPQAPKGDLAGPDFDYIALGHIHKFQDLNRGNQPPIVYSGSIERIDFGERNEPKGYVIADVARGHTEYKFIPVNARPFVEIELDLTTGGGDPTDRILEAVAKHDLSLAVVKLTYRINSADAPLLREPEIRQALGTAFLVAAIHKEIVRDDKRDQSRLLQEPLDPLQALAAYIDTRETLRVRREELLALARALVEETTQSPI
jgi:exonuclease SbcD